MPKLVAEVKASHFHRTGADSSFVIHKMKTGSIRGADKSLSFRASRNVQTTNLGPLGIPNDDWTRLIFSYTILYGLMTALFAGLMHWNMNITDFTTLWVYFGLFMVTVVVIIYVSVVHYQQRMQMNALASA